MQRDVVVQPLRVGAVEDVPGETDEAHNAQVHINPTEVCAQFRTERTFVQWGFSGTLSGLILAPYARLIEGVWGSRDGGEMALVKLTQGHLLENPQ